MPAALFHSLATHVSKDDPTTTFEIGRVETPGKLDVFNVSCLKDTPILGEQNVHWSLDYSDEAKAWAEYNRWLNS